MAKKFVCVRVQSMNNVNVDHFQFEYDLTWMSFFQNSDGNTYTRYGGRQDSRSESHLTKKSLVSVMQQALKLHEAGDVKPTSKYEPLPKLKRKTLDLPTLKTAMSTRQESCIHCHDVKMAQLRHLRNQGTLKKEMIFTYPSPSNLGMYIDPDKQRILSKVAVGSEAAKAGFLTGDQLKTVDNQRVLTYADFTRVLELAPATGKIDVVAMRGTKEIRSEIRLTEGWKRSSDPSWRESISIIGPGPGFWGLSLSPKRRTELGLEKDAIGIVITYVEANAKDAGVKRGSIIIAIDGQKRVMNLDQLKTHLHWNHDWGDTVSITILHKGKERKLQLKLPSKPQP